MEEKHKCGCGEEHCHENPKMEEIATIADDKIDAVIKVLVKKGIVTMEELDEAYAKLYKDTPEK